MIKFIVTDLDGSLLTDSKELPPDFFEIADALFAKGITFMIASGRPYHNISAIFNSIQSRLYFACDNGSFLVFNKEELLVTPLQKEEITTFINVARSIEKVYPVLCGKQLAFIENTNEKFIQQALKYYQEFKIVDDLTKVSETILKISLCALDGAETNCYPFYKKFEEAYKVTVGGEMWLDITNINASKGNAVSCVQDRLHITPQETVVFGDYLNDLDMIENAGYSYAMKNGHPEIKKAAKYITDLDNNHFGVTETIKELFQL